MTRSVLIAALLMIAVHSVGASGARAQNILNEDWESGQGLWNVDAGVWQVGIPTAGPDSAYGGVQCAGTVLGGPYPSTSDSRLVSPPVELTRNSPDDAIVLEIWHWYSIQSDDSAWVEISVGGGVWQRISGSFRGASPAWTRFAVDLTAFAGQSVEVGFRFASGGIGGSFGWYIDDVRIVSEPLVFRNPETFENGVGLWVADGGLWEVGPPTAGPDSAYGGMQCAGTILGAPYPSVSDSRLISPPVELTRNSPDDAIVLEIWHWYSISSADSAWVELSVAGGSWQKVSPPFVGSSSGWTRYAIDLTAREGETVQVAFHFTSLGIGGSQGWYIDDVRIVSEPLLFKNPETFEDGVGQWAADGGVWQVGIPTFGPDSAYGGVLCAGTVLDGPYPSLSDTRLISPPVDLVPNSFDDPIVFSMWHWYSIQSEDSAWVEVRVSGGPWLRASPAFLGTSGGWTRYAVNLTPFSGQTVELAFRFTSKGIGGSFGWYIDDVSVLGIGGAFRSEVVFASRATVGDRRSRPLELYNFSSAAVLLDGVTSSDPAFALPESFVDSMLAGEVTIPERSSITARIDYAPLVPGAHDGQLAFVSGADTVALVAVSGSARDLSFQVLLDQLYPDREVEEGDEVVIPVQMADSVEADSVVVIYGEGGSSARGRATMIRVNDDPVNDSYLRTVPGSAAGARGLEISVVAYNGSVSRMLPAPNTPAVFRVRVADLAFDQPLPPERYRLISFPIELPNNSILGTLTDDLGVPDPAVWRLFSYESSSGGSPGYAELPNDTITAFEQARGYWIVARDAVRLDTGASPGVSTSTAAPFEVTLEPGWNLVGHPFYFDVAWDSVIVDTVSASEAAGVLIERPLRYRPSTGYAPLGDVLVPFEGYWIRNVTAQPVRLFIPPVEAPAAPVPTSPALIQPDGSSGWRLRISASSGHLTDGNNVIGIDPQADNERDRFDAGEPPASPGESLSLYLPHWGWETHPGAYAVDIRRSPGGLDPAMLRGVDISLSAGATYTAWRLDIARNFSHSDTGDDVTLAFFGVDDIPGDARVVLVDRLARTWVDLREHTTVSLRVTRRDVVSDERDARFAVIVGTGIDDHLPSPPGRDALHACHPNPFNPETVIPYDIARTSDVTLSIYDVRGRHVTTLVERALPPGRYRARWNGTDDRGHGVSSGVYFTRLTTTDGVHTSRLVLLK